MSFSLSYYLTMTILTVALVPLLRSELLASSPRGYTNKVLRARLTLYSMVFAVIFGAALLMSWSLVWTLPIIGAVHVLIYSCMYLHYRQPAVRKCLRRKARIKDQRCRSKHRMARQAIRHRESTQRLKHHHRRVRHHYRRLARI